VNSNYGIVNSMIRLHLYTIGCLKHFMNQKSILILTVSMLRYCLASFRCGSFFNRCGSFFNRYGKEATVCIFCDSGEPVDDEFHLLTRYSFYEDIRKHYIPTAQPTMNGFIKLMNTK
jgi:hypothetical protein